MKKSKKLCDSDIAYRASLDQSYGYQISDEQFEWHRKQGIKLIKCLLKYFEDEYREQYLEWLDREAKKPVNPKLILESRVEIHEKHKCTLGSETILIADRFGEELSGRKAAKALSRKIQSNIKKCILTKLDFKGVKSIDNGFSDEAIGKIVILAGEDHFNRKVQIVNTSKSVAEKIQSLINERKELLIECGMPYKYTEPRFKPSDSPWQKKLKECLALAKQNQS
jgi:hypothetical protein